MTLSQTSGQVTEPRVRVGITVFCIVALPRDRLGITAREVRGPDKFADAHVGELDRGSEDLGDGSPQWGPEENLTDGPPKLVII